MGEKRRHIVLNSYDERALEFIRASQGGKMPRSKAIRTCIRSVARQLGFKEALDAYEEVFPIEKHPLSRLSGR